MRSFLSASPSNAAIKARVVDMFTQIIQEVDPTKGTLLAHLFQERVISMDMHQRLKNLTLFPTSIASCEQLLMELLKSTNRTAFVALREGLMDEYHWIVEQIDESAQLSMTFLIVLLVRKYNIL